MARALHLHCHGALPRRTATALGAFAVGEPDNGCTGSLACHEFVGMPRDPRRRFPDSGGLLDPRPSRLPWRLPALRTQRPRASSTCRQHLKETVQWTPHMKLPRGCSVTPKPLPTRLWLWPGVPHLRDHRDRLRNPVNEKHDPDGWAVKGCQCVMYSDQFLRLSSRRPAVTTERQNTRNGAVPTG